MISPFASSQIYLHNLTQFYFPGFIFHHSTYQHLMVFVYFYFSLPVYCHFLFILREFSRSGDFDVFTSLSLVLGTEPGTNRATQQIFPIMNEFLYYLGRT